jgi:O-methyltransferase involved in polyketide biosynthesis
MPRTPLHDTAFVISGYRAADEPLSGDVYATHWVTAAAQAWVQAYTRDVSAAEPFVQCLRNRFFLEQIAAFFREHPGAVLVNLGCGFSAYPHLLPATHQYCDADVTEVVQYKQEKLAVWERNGTFPARAIHYVAMNLDDEASRQHCEAQLRHWLAGQASFVLLEGVLLLLKKASVLALFAMCARLQTPGSRVGAVSLVPEIRHTAVMPDFWPSTGGPWAVRTRSTRNWRMRSTGASPATPSGTRRTISRLLRSILPTVPPCVRKRY